MQASATVQPATAPQTVAWTSSNAQVATVDASGTVTPVAVGTVTITATSTADATQSASANLTINGCPDPRLVTGSLTDHTTWQNWIPNPACFDYVVQASTGSNSFDLTIEAGTVVGFEEGLGIRMRNDAAIIAQGTQQDPIVLTGTSSQRGFWKGLSMESTRHARNVLEWVTVEYTGGAGLSGVEDASVMLLDGEARIQNSTFQESTGYAVAVGRISTITAPAGNQYTKSALGSAWSWATAVPSLAGADLTGNDVDEVVVLPINIVQSADWPQAVYRILQGGNLAVTGGVLTLAPGSTLLFEEGQAMSVTRPGELSAVGTAGAPILLSGTVQVRGHWDGLGFFGAQGHLEHVTVEYGGRESFGGVSEKANLVLTRAGSAEPSNVTIRSSTFRESAEYGLWVRLNSGLPSFDANTLTSNAAAPIYLHPTVADQLTASSTFSGNGVDEVIVEVASGFGITSAVTWRDLGVPYYLQFQVGPVLAVDAPWTIEAGVEVLMEADLGISIQNGATLTAKGAQDDPIIMGAKAGKWKGLRFLGAQGNFEFFQISDGGSETWSGGVSTGANITLQQGALGASSNILFEQQVFSSSAPFDLAFGPGSTFANCLAFSVWVPAGDSPSDHCG